MHLRHNIGVDINSLLRVVFVDVLLEARETQLVSVFEITIIFCIFLYSVVCQMHEGIINVLEIDSELSR